MQVVTVSAKFYYYNSKQSTNSMATTSFCSISIDEHMQAVLTAKFYYYYNSNNQLAATKTASMILQSISISQCSTCMHACMHACKPVMTGNSQSLTLK